MYIKKILIILFLSFPSIAFGEWIKLSYNDLSEFYFDKSTIKIISDDTIEYVELINLKKPIISLKKGVSSYSMINIKIVNCGTNQSKNLYNTPSKHKYLRINSFSKNMGKGDFIGTEKGENKWIIHQTGSVEYKVSKSLCNTFLIKENIKSKKKNEVSEKFVQITSRENNDIFYDSNSLKLTSDSTIEYVELTNHNKLSVDKKTGKLMSSTKSIKILNCNPIQYKYLRHEYFPEKFGKGKLIDFIKLNQNWFTLLEKHKLNQNKAVKERVESLLKVHEFLCSKYIN